jgi:two-component system phosphoglycerate transport system response regulator PgtA
VKVILVEDNADLVESMRVLLQLHGHEAKCYLTASEALDDLGSIGEQDLVVSDYYLPDLNGVELLKRIRAERPGVRAILLTGSREDGIVEAAQSISGCGVLFKPLEYEALARSMKAML